MPTVQSLRADLDALYFRETPAPDHPGWDDRIGHHPPPHQLPTAEVQSLMLLCNILLTWLELEHSPFQTTPPEAQA